MCTYVFIYLFYFLFVRCNARESIVAHREHPRVVGGAAANRLRRVGTRRTSCRTTKKDEDEEEQEHVCRTIYVYICIHYTYIQTLTVYAFFTPLSKHARSFGFPLSAARVHRLLWHSLRRRLQCALYESCTTVSRYSDESYNNIILIIPNHNIIYVIRRVYLPRVPAARRTRPPRNTRILTTSPLWLLLLLLMFFPLLSKHPGGCACVTMFICLDVSHNRCLRVTAIAVSGGRTHAAENLRQLGVHASHRIVRNAAIIVILSILFYFFDIFM